MNNRTTSRLRRIAAVVAGAATAALVLSGCLYSMIPEESAPAASKTPDTSGVADDLLPFYGQEIDWSSCGPSFDCADVKAPLDWENPDDGEIELAIVRHRASGTAKGSLLVNPGGPGASGKDFVRDSLDYAVGPDLIDSFDVVGFDPRGVGESTAVTCYDAEQMDEFLYGIPKSPRNTPAWEAELNARNKGFSTACDENSGGILPFVTTVNAARDMDLLRAVLGDKELNYLGYSYGTFVGATYAKLYPERATHLVLDGAIDPSVPGLEVGTTQALGFESALTAYLEDCVSGRECPFNGTVDEARADLSALLAAVDRNPLKGGDGRLMGADTMLTGIIQALYSQDYWGYLSQALSGALQGDPTQMFFLADSYNGRDEDGTYADNQTEAFSAYNCMDYPVDTDPADEQAAREKVEKGAPTLAPYWSAPDPCLQWPYPATGVREKITAPGSGPILVVGTTNDPATPYDWSVSLADQLENGVLITRVGEGHTGYNKGNSCVDDAVESFLLDSTVPKDGLRCG
ncbi:MULTISPECIES: alpha/beta hydrolase [unclassified Microbacterium]|uniref:alpha/beta hydrolase n=1 Tax=unclassified Microbacterium TaxID=2609290 RepID=UPI002FCD4641